MIGVEEVYEPTGHIPVDGERFAHCDPYALSSIAPAQRRQGTETPTEVVESAKASALGRGFQWSRTRQKGLNTSD